MNWFSKAAKQGDANALFGIGSVHFIRRDFSLALQYYKLAGDKGYSRAFHWLGYMYQQGLGVSRNIEVATDYYNQGAAQGYIIAERALIHLAFKHGTILNKIFALPKYVLILVKAAIIAHGNINDERIVDVPNVYANRKGQKGPKRPGSQ